MTREPSHDMWDAALHAALTHSHARDGHPEPLTLDACAVRSCRTSVRLDWDAVVCEHDVVFCGYCDPADGCPECAEGGQS